MSKLKETRVIDGIVWTGDLEAFDALEKLFQEQKKREASIPWEQISMAMTRITECLRFHDGTDSSLQLKRFVWSLWNGQHFLNLYNLGCILDQENSDAVALLFSAYMRGILREEHLRLILEQSGEMARWDDAAEKTSIQKPVDYPPIARLLRKHCLKLGELEP